MDRSKEAIDLDKRLMSIFANINSWLKFAEAKNLALITFCTALLVCDIQLLKDLHETHYLLLGQYFILLLVGTISFALVSVFAQMDNREEFKKHLALQDSYNLLYYGDIANMDDMTYLTNFYKRYYPDFDIEGNISRYQMDLAKQIIINSRIVVRKNNSFNRSVSFFIAGVIDGIGIFFLT